MNEFLQVLVQFVGVGNAVDFGGGDEQFTVTLTRKKEIEDGSRSSAAADLSTVPDAELTARPASTGKDKANV